MITKFEAYDWKKRLMDEVSQYKLGQRFDQGFILEYVQELHDIKGFDDTDLFERINSYSYYILEEIDIKDLESNEFDWDETVVDEYSKLTKDRDFYPTIVVGDLGNKNYTIIDGTHRLNSLKKLGYEKVKAFVGQEYSQYFVDDEFDEE